MLKLTKITALLAMLALALAAAACGDHDGDSTECVDTE